MSGCVKNGRDSHLVAWLQKLPVASGDQAVVRESGCDDLVRRWEGPEDVRESRVKTVPCQQLGRLQVGNSELFNLIG